MRKITISALFILFTSAISIAQNTYVPSYNFENYLETHDSDGNTVSMGSALSMGNGVIDDYVPTNRIDTVTNLDISDLGITTLTGIQDFAALTYLNCGSNSLTHLNVSDLSNLVTLYCRNNSLTSLILPSEVNVLERLSCRQNQLTSVNVSMYSNLTLLRFDDNDLYFLDVKNGNNTNVTTFNALGNPNLVCINVDDATWATANWSNIDATASFGESCYTYIPDDNFEQAIIDLGYDNVLDDYVLTEAINSLTELHIDNLGIDDLTGIEDFQSLENLYCQNNHLTSFDISNNLALEILYCNNNQLSNLDISANTNLLILDCYSNQLTQLDLSSNIGLLSLYCQDNHMSNLDLTANTDRSTLTKKDVTVTRN
jgi:hypothetical protein